MVIYGGYGVSDASEIIKDVGMSYQLANFLLTYEHFPFKHFFYPVS